MSIEENIARGWADIEGFPGYRITIDGRLFTCRSKKSGRWGVKTLKDTWTEKKEEVNPKGYAVTNLSSDGARPKRAQIHRLVAMCFIPNPQNKPQVNHINGIRNDNRVQNLEWVTNGENQLHSFRIMGRETMKGTKNGRAKITDEDIIKIRQRLKNGEKQWIVAKDYNVRQGTISKINIGIRWKHV